jgi:hypothetical protein
VSEHAQRSRLLGPRIVLPETAEEHVDLLLTCTVRTAQYAQKRETGFYGRAAVLIQRPNAGRFSASYDGERVTVVSSHETYSVEHRLLGG